MEVLGWISCFAIMISIVISVLLNIWCLFIVSFLMVDFYFGEKLMSEDKHHKRRKKIRIVK